MYITKTPSTNVPFNRREVNVFRQMKEALMRKTRLKMYSYYMVVMEGLYFKHFNIKLDKKSEAFLKEMLIKNSCYGSVDTILTEAV